MDEDYISTTTNERASTNRIVNHDFSSFSKLPPELRHKIWTLSLPGKRCIRYNRWRPGPTALLVTYESRQVALRHYRLSAHPRGGYIDFATDSIDSESICEARRESAHNFLIPYRPQIHMLADLTRIKNVSVTLPQYIMDWRGYLHLFVQSFFQFGKYMKWFPEIEDLYLHASYSLQPGSNAPNTHEGRGFDIMASVHSSWSMADEYMNNPVFERHRHGNGYPETMPPIRFQFNVQTFKDKVYVRLLLTTRKFVWSKEVLPFSADVIEETVTALWTLTRDPLLVDPQDRPPEAPPEG